MGAILLCRRQQRAQLRMLCSFIPDVIALLLLPPSAMRLVLPLHILKGLPEPDSGPGGSFPFLQSTRA